jgi:hypothetical protein
MRKLLAAGVLISALIMACETKTPVGPAGLTPTTSTTTTSSPTTTPTTSSTTTTSVIIRSLSMSYQAFNPPPNVPAQMTLFARLLTPSSAPGDAFGLLEQSAPENEYEITGVYVMGNGTTGSVTGTLGNSLDPLELGGVFIGHLNAKTTSGCTAERDFSGTLSRLTLQWHGDAPGTSTCSPSPLNIPEFTMLRSDPGAPLPTTSSVNCTYSLNPTSDPSVPTAGGTRSVSVVTQAGCGWTAQSLVSWITGVQPSSGTGTTVISYTVAATTAERSDPAALRIASINFPVTQGGTPADLWSPVAVACSAPSPAQTVTITVQNKGGTTAPASQTTIDFVGSESATLDPAIRNNGILAAGASTTISAPIPEDCYTGCCPSETCSFSVVIDSRVPQDVVESDEVNNVIKLATCSRPNAGLTAPSRDRR